MSHHLGFLYFDDGIEVREIINHARTIEHLRNSGISCGTIGIIDDECPVLYLDQCDYTPLSFTTPDALINPAPWNDGTGTPSADGYGFWIDEWTGLDSAHIRRGATAKYPIGSTFGPLGQSHRVWKMNVKLFGANGAALEDLFRWLEESLIQCCSPGVTAWIRTTCPEGYGNDYGLVHVIDAQLLEGPEWLTPPIEELGCIMRLVSFTIGVGDPCLYRPPVQCLDEDVFPAVVLCDLGLDGIFGCPDNEDAFVDYRLCCAVVGQRIGVTAPVVVIRNDGATSFSPPMRVVGITDNGSGCVVANNEIFGEVRISGIPPQSELMIDCARRRVLWRPVGFIRPWEPGYVYLDRSIDAVPDYPAVGCTDALIFVEPTAITPSLVDLKVNAWMVGRYGCC